MIQSELHGDMQRLAEMTSPSVTKTESNKDCIYHASLSKTWLYAGKSVYPTLLA
jgi:hypothetical protein